MKITIAQLNPVIGDINGNLTKVKNALAESNLANSDLVVFSELFLVGYPPKDLLERPWFIQKVNAAVEELIIISEQFPNMGMIIGVPLLSSRPTGKGLVNAALLIYQGQLLFAQQKSLLPSYDVFDEARHFDPATEIDIVPFKDEKLGIIICEDAWNDPDLWPEQAIYDFDPVSQLVSKGASLLINISASPFYLGKDELRYNLIRNHARKHGIPFIFVNQVGGNDELIFDGGSMGFDRNGDPMIMAPFFQEQIQTIELKRNGFPSSYVPFDKIESVYQALVLGTRDYIRKCGFRKAVVGLSGGIDSALVAALAVAALGKENVLGITMPSPFSSGGSVEDSRQLAHNLGIDFKVIPISPIYQAYLDSFQEHFQGLTLDVTEENIQARIRGNILMAFSNKFGYLALSTGNKSELAVGYCTLYGDMSGGLSVISDVPKTMVYELANFINKTQEIIPKTIMDKAPSAELKPDQKDQDTLPPYPVLDQILYYYVEEGYSLNEIVKLGFEPEIVRWVVRTVDQNEYKRKQAAPGLKVTSKAFGVGRRMPVAKKIEY